MSKEVQTPTKPAVAASHTPSADVDLSAELNIAVEKQVGETVKCVHVFGDHYRCNWWGHEASSTIGKPLPSGFDVTSQRVRRSSFLRASKTAAGLQIEDLTISLGNVIRLK